jgi:hypothetical protein
MKQGVLMEHKRVNSPLGLSGVQLFIGLKTIRVWLRLHLKTDELHQQVQRSNVRVVNFNPNNQNTNVNNDNANNQNDNRGAVLWLRVYWLCEDLSHPPSILPISSN